MNTYHQWMIHWYNKQISTNTKYWRTHVNKEFGLQMNNIWQTWQIPERRRKWCLCLIWRDQSGVNCQARGQSGNEKVLCIICTLLPEILVSLLSPLFLIYNSIVFRKSDPGLDIRDTIKYVLLILIHLFLKSSLRHIFLQHANPCIFQNVYVYF